MLIADSFARRSLFAFPDHFKNFGERNELAGASKESDFPTRMTLGSTSPFNVELDAGLLYCGDLALSRDWLHFSRLAGVGEHLRLPYGGDTTKWAEQAPRCGG